MAWAVAVSANSGGALNAQQQISNVPSIEDRATGGDPAAQRQLACIYEQGFGVSRDYARAAFWYRKAADQGNSSAQNNLANLFADGRGLVRDYVQSAFWYRQAAQKGVANAQVQLALQLKNGQGVPQNNAEAATWYRRAAEQNDPNAQYGLGSMYFVGEGVSLSYSEAYFWLAISAVSIKGEASPAAALRDAVADDLSPTALSDAQWRASQWFAEHPVPLRSQNPNQTSGCFNTP
jgi:TPR repeat protein